MRRSLFFVVAMAACVLGAGGPAHAVVLAESPDAGSSLATAQATAGAVEQITGSIADASDEDVYRVCLDGGRTFSASTTGSEAPDPQLFLFDASGRGVYANDDFNGLQSVLPAGGPLTPSAGGVYYLAISNFANRPVSPGGQIFDYVSFPLLEPVGPGGRSPLTGWTDEGFSGGSYRITLTGTRPCLPTTKGECKSGGWATFGVFSNQGDCVSFVATAGRNVPAGARPGG